MHVKLKGLNRKKVRLTTGCVVTYYYAWKGGPRIQEDYGTKEFVAAYLAALNHQQRPYQKTLLSLLKAYQDTDKFRSKAERTRRDYIKHIEKIEKEFGNFPIAALDDRRARDEFLTWRDRLALNSHRQAEYTFVVFALILAWAKDRGKISHNPLEKMGRIYRGSRNEIIWTDADEEAFLRIASEPLKLAMRLALNTGQRQGDLLKLTWSAYDGVSIRLMQSKTGTRVFIPVTSQLKAMLDNTKRQSPTILVNYKGLPWTPDGFRTSWRKTCARAGIYGVTFNDTRGTAVTRLAIAGCTEAEIATITGHALRDVKSILDAHYLRRDPALAISAIQKLERRTKTPE